MPLVILLGVTPLVILLVWDVWAGLAFSVQPAVSRAAQTTTVVIRQFILKADFMGRKKGWRGLECPILSFPRIRGVKYGSELSAKSPLFPAL